MEAMIQFASLYRQLDVKNQKRAERLLRQLKKQQDKSLPAQFPRQMR